MHALLLMGRDSPRDILTFFSEIAVVVPKGKKAVQAELIAWHRTVEVWQDPEQLEALLNSSSDVDDYVEVHRPEAISA